MRGKHFNQNQLEIDNRYIKVEHKSNIIYTLWGQSCHLPSVYFTYDSLKILLKYPIYSFSMD